MPRGTGENWYVDPFAFVRDIRRPMRSAPKYLLIAISCIGWVTNHFTGTRFHNQSDISAAVGALAVGFVANIYGRFFNGSAFVVMASVPLPFAVVGRRALLTILYRSLAFYSSSLLDLRTGASSRSSSNRSRGRPRMSRTCLASRQRSSSSPCVSA